MRVEQAFDGYCTGCDAFVVPRIERLVAELGTVILASRKEEVEREEPLGLKAGQILSSNLRGRVL